MGTVNDPPSQIDHQLNLNDIQGDIWSKGFPKFYETYYFFSIEPSKAKIFAQCLKDLPPLISTLKKVKEDQDRITKARAEDIEAAKKKGIPEKDVTPRKIPISNALIAFTYKGLKTIQNGLPGDLKLSEVANTDKAFFRGMVKDKDILRDPHSDTWDKLFQSLNIHGMLKIGGSSKDKVDDHLKEIQKTLKHGTAIVDAFRGSPSTPADSRVDGWTRPNDRGKEHFGFQDCISRPRMDGIDDLEPEPDPKADAVVNMNTDPKLLIVRKDTHSENMPSDEDGGRPEWMYNGSFLVFRKLEQNVKAFREVTMKEWKGKQDLYESPAYVAAKLMGRWESGAPLAMSDFHTKDSRNSDTAKLINNFGYNGDVCPVAAHIRKTNIREKIPPNFQDPRAERTRMIRNGIPYGSDYNEKDETDKSTRGLLFACYQGNIEDGFQNMQGNWSNSRDFRELDAGLDPIIGQVLQKPDGVNGEVKTIITDKKNGRQSLTFQQLVTLKGGEYFFVPSISALSGELSKT